FIKACKAIIDIVMFIIERGAQIIAFVNAVLDAVIAIAGGGAGGVPGLIEKALALSLPVLIGFLAALLGIGGLADKVKKLFQSLSKPVMKAVDWIVGKIAAFGKKLWAKMKSKLGGKKDPSKMTVVEKTKVAKQAANDGFRSASRVPIDDIPGALDGVYAKWQAKGLKGLRVVPKGGHAFTVKASVNPDVDADAKGTVDTSDIPPEALTVEQAAAESFASSTTWATGTFSADSAPEVSGIMKSGAPTKDLEMSDSQKKAHAEEQVVNTFYVGWNDRVSKISGNLKPAHRSMKFFEKARMVIHVTKSSCINCASQIVRFKRELHKKSKSVSVDMKFASTFQGPQEVSKSNVDEFARLIPMFLKKARLTPRPDEGRLWGLSSLFGKKKEQVYTTSGKDAGKAGIAILRNQGVNVEALERDDLQAQKGTTRQEIVFDDRKKRLEKDLQEVEDKLKQIKKGS
ncbi:MAG: hypothetical protein ACRDX9_05970, partial [Acidimicrobiia bacterium]